MTQLDIGAIVNAANEGLWAGGGICGMKHSNNVTTCIAKHV